MNQSFVWFRWGRIVAERPHWWSSSLENWPLPMAIRVHTGKRLSLIFPYLCRITSLKRWRDAKPYWHGPTVPHQEHPLTELWEWDSLHIFRIITSCTLSRYKQILCVEGANMGLLGRLVLRSFLVSYLQCRSCLEMYFLGEVLCCIYHFPPSQKPQNSSLQCNNECTWHCVTWYQLSSVFWRTERRRVSSAIRLLWG